MANKKVVLVISVIGIILIFAIIAFKVKSLNITYTFDEVSVETNNISKDKEKEKQNVAENNALEEQNTLENEKVQNEVTTQNQEENKVDSKNEEDSKENIQMQQSREEKAITLAKSKWGEDDSVYYTIDRIVGSCYNICVRNKSTTESLAEYEVDIEKETVTLK